jgi:hypothetical protein
MAMRRVMIGTAAAVTAVLASWLPSLAFGKSPVTPKHRFDSSLVTIRSPEPGSPVFSGGVRVVLQVRAGTRVRLRLGRRDVTKRFHPAARGRLIGTLRLADIGRGPKTLHVLSSRGSTHDKDFLLLVGTRTHHGFLRVRLHHTGSGASPVDLSIHTAAIRVFLRVRLNGHRLEQKMIPGRLRDRSLRLTALHGLRFGRNTLTVLAHDGRGTGDEITKVFTVPRIGPMPAARYPTIAHVASQTALDAGLSRAAHGGRLLYGWRLLDAPRGSRARVRGATRRKASIRIDRPGRYRIKLVVTERPRRHGSRGQAARAQSTSYQFVMEGQPTISPYGEAVSTGSQAGIVVGGTTYSPPPLSFGGIQVLIIDRATGQVTNAEIDSANKLRDIATLADDMSDNNGSGPSGPFANTGTGQIVVIEAGWWQPTTGLSSTVVNELQSDLAMYGVDDPTGDANALIQGAPFAMVAVRGMDAGQAVVNPDGIQSGQVVQNSDGDTLNGVLRVGPDGYLRFEQIDLVPYNTNQPGEPATLGPVGGTTASTPATSAGEISLDVLDAHTLQQVGVPVTIQPQAPVLPLVQLLNQYVPNPCTPTQSPSPAEVRCDTSASNPNDAVLFVLRYNAYEPGTDQYALADFHALVQDLAEVGVNRDTLIRSSAFTSNPVVQGGSDYVFIGGPGVSGIEGSTLKTVANSAGQQVPVSGPQQQGFLVRDEHGRLTPAGGTNSANFDPELEVMAATPPVQFGYPGTDVAAYQAAEDHLFEEYFASGILNGLPQGFRVNYGTTAFTDAVPSILTQLHCQTTVGQPPSMLRGEYPKNETQFTKVELDQMRRMLCDEMLRQETVETNLFGPLRAIFLDEKVDGTLDLLGADSTLAGYVQESYPVPHVDPLEVAASISSLLGSLVDDLAPDDVEGPSEVASLLSMAGDAMTVATGFTRQDTTSVTFNHTVGEIDVEAGQLSTWVENRFNDAQDAVDEIEGVVFSNPNSLVTAYNRAIGANGVWNLGTASNPILSRTGPIVFDSQLSSLNYMYPHLVAAAAKPSCDQHQDTPYPQNHTPPITVPGMQYWAWIDVGQAGSPTIAIPFVAQLSSLDFSTPVGDSLGQTLFSDGGQGYVQGTPPTAASIVASDFFMDQIAPNNTTCTYTSNLWG